MLNRQKSGKVLAMGILFLLMPAVLQCDEQKGMNKIIKSIAVKEAPIGDVLTLLAQETELSFTSTQEVQGKVTVYLSDVTAQTVLDVILENNGWKYAPTPDGKIIQVMTAAQYDERLKTTKPILTAEYTARYVTLDELTSVLRILLSPEGMIIPVKSTNKVVIRDVPEVVENASRIYALVDVPPRSAEASGLEKQIEAIHTTDAPIADVLTLLTKESGITFMCSPGLRDKVSMNMNHTTIQAILTTLCSQYGYGYIAIPQSNTVKVMTRKQCEKLIKR